MVTESQRNSLLNCDRISGNFLHISPCCVRLRMRHGSVAIYACILSVCVVFCVEIKRKRHRTSWVATSDNKRQKSREVTVPQMTRLELLSQHATQHSDESPWRMKKKKLHLHPRTRVGRRVAAATSNEEVSRVETTTTDIIDTETTTNNTRGK